MEFRLQPLDCLEFLTTNTVVILSFQTSWALSLYKMDHMEHINLAYSLKNIPITKNSMKPRGFSLNSIELYIYIYLCVCVWVGTSKICDTQLILICPFNGLRFQYGHICLRLHKITSKSSDRGTEGHLSSREFYLSIYHLKTEDSVKWIKTGGKNHKRKRRKCYRR